MKNFLNSLSSLYWWASVVLVGILINLFSAYLKSKLDARLSRMSSWWRKRSDIQKAKETASICELRNEPHKQVLFCFNAILDGISAVCFCTLSVVALLPPVISVGLQNQLAPDEPSFSTRHLVVSVIFPFLLAVISFSLGTKYLYSAYHQLYLIKRANSEQTGNPETDTNV